MTDNPLSPITVSRICIQCLDGENPTITESKYGIQTLETSSRTLGYFEHVILGPVSAIEVDGKPLSKALAYALPLC